MEPAPLFKKLGATPAPQVDLLDTRHSHGLAGGDPGLDIPLPPTISDDGDGAPYLRQRITDESGPVATPTPLLIDLTHLAVPMPEVPQAMPPPVELQSLPPLDPADETGVTRLETVLKPSRLALSRPLLASLGVMAFSAGLLTAATAGVLARPARTVAAAQSRPAPQTTAPAAAPASAAAPVLAAAEVAAPVAPPTSAGETPIARTTSAPLAAAPAAKTAPVPSGKGRAKAGSPARARGRAPARTRSGTRVDPGAGPQVLASPATEAEPAEPVKEAPPAAAPAKRGANWVDPFAE